MSRATQLVMESERTGWEVYQDLVQAMMALSTTELLSLAREALSSVVAMAASDELARRRPVRR